MRVLKATIESMENNFSAFIENVDGVVAVGSTIQEIKTNLLDALDVYVETCKEMKCDLPKELKGQYRVEFTMDVKTLLTLLEGTFTKAGLERLTGINQKQLWHYAKGGSSPRRTQVLKIENALHNLGNALISLHL